MAAQLAIPHYSTGDLLRSIRKSPDADRELVAQLSSFMDAGKLVPAALMSSLIVPKLRAASQGYLLDGYPPSVSDAVALGQGGVFPTAVLVVEIDDEVAARRQVRGLNSLRSA